ncbi:M24 family metallopeptidase [Candidatus Peregrinibacteria bacterium]|nr:M24 family metallopeptidase [Candidatus Peregrinibacteria bacterium]
MKIKPQASLITNKSNIRYLSDFTGSTGFILLTKPKKYLFTDFRYIKRAKNTIKKGIEIVDTTKMWKNPDELKKNWQKILKNHRVNALGIEESSLTIAKFKKFKKISGGKIKFTDISGKIEKLREIKSKKEINLIRNSQRINEKVFLEIKKIVQKNLNSKKTLTERNLAWNIKELGHKFGTEDVSFDPIVSFGKNTAIPHHLPDKTRLKKGDIILIDMGMKYKGYCSDMTRILFTKIPTKFQKEIYNLVLKAQKTAIKGIKAGISGKKADKFARDIINKAGYKENFGHGSGHGVGLDIHEAPSLSENYTKTIKNNSIITIEPGIYLENHFGIRIEDMILVTKTGNKNLTKIPK